MNFAYLDALHNWEFVALIFDDFTFHLSGKLGKKTSKKVLLVFYL